RQEDLSPSRQSDVSAAADRQHVVVQRVLQCRKRGGKTTLRWAVDLEGALHVESVMWTIFVELAPVFVEAFLLLQEVLPRRPRGFRFQRAMHSLVTAILFRMRRLSSFVPDTETEPICRQA